MNNIRFIVSSKLYVIETFVWQKEVGKVSLFMYFAIKNSYNLHRINLVLLSLVHQRLTKS